MNIRHINRLFPMILAAAGFATLSPQALAERGDLSASVKYGLTQASDIDVEGGGAIKADGGSAFGLSIGYEYDANWTAEFMYISGEGDDNEPGFLPIDIDYTSIGLFGVYRTPIQLSSPYFLGKIGVSKTDIEASSTGGSNNQDATGLSFGAGVGYQYSEKLAIEAEFFRDAEEVSFILVSARFQLDI